MIASLRRCAEYAGQNNDLCNLPFAAYLLPPDIEVGEEVMLDDLIEDMLGTVWNQGDTYRLQCCRARWTGSDFELLYSPEDDAQHVIG